MAERMSGVRRWIKSKLGGESGEIEIDAKTPQKVYKSIMKLIQYTTNKKLNLKNSPPYLQGILIDTHNLITKIFKVNSLDSLKVNEYLALALYKVLLQTKKTIQLFRDAGDEMENEDSESRRELNKFTLVFSHMLAEFRTIFKGGEFRNEFKIVKQEPRDFWAREFGKRVIVPWDEFLSRFKTVHKVTSTEEAIALKMTIDLTENDHVSWFEFDIFTRLFQPWKQIMNNWNVIVVTHPGYLAFMTYDEVEAVLKQFKHKPGSYVFRLSCTRLGQWAIGFVTAEGNIVQTIPQSKSLYQALIDGAADRSYIYPKGQSKNPDIRKRISVAPEQHIKVTKEQYDIYCDIESTFEICKICDTNVKSMRIDPCGHLLCKKCLQHWMEQSRNGRGQASCPFCREPIMSAESIVVEPYRGPDGGLGKPGYSSDESDDDDDGAACGAPPPLPPARPLPSLPPTSSSSQHGSSSRKSSSTSSVPPVDPMKLRQMEEMGFGKQKSIEALTRAHGDVGLAVTYIT